MIVAVTLSVAPADTMGALAETETVMTGGGLDELPHPALLMTITAAIASAAGGTQFFDIISILQPGPKRLPPSFLRNMRGFRHHERKGPCQRRLGMGALSTPNYEEVK